MKKEEEEICLYMLDLWQINQGWDIPTFIRQADTIEERTPLDILTQSDVFLSRAEYNV